MKYRNARVLLAAILLMLAGEPPLAEVLCLGSIQGEMRECHCAGGPAGGLARIKTAVDEYRRTYKEMIMVGRGDQYGFQPDTLRDKTISKVISTFKYTAIGLGATDFINGGGWLKKNINAGGITFVNCNVLWRNAPMARAYLIVASHGRRLGITSALSRQYLETPVFKGKLSDTRVLPAVKEILKVISELSKQADEIIVISHLTAVDEGKLLKGYSCAKPLLLLTGRPFGGKDTSYTEKNVTVIKLGGLGRHAAFIKDEPSGSQDRGKCFKLGGEFKPDGIITKLLDEVYPVKEPVLSNLPKSLGTKLKGAEALVFYYAPDCPDCRQIINDSLPLWKERAGINVEMVDISVPANYFRLMEDEKKAGAPSTEMPVVLYRNKMYSGKEAIYKKLRKEL
jgi:thiol-disulfide isomerase/thioredoxin